MEFGRVPNDQLNGVDFSLPADCAINKTILSGKKIKNPKLYIGCAKWGRPEWVGKIYPPKTKEKDFLEHYVKHYNSIELNATHYKVYGEPGIKKWVEKVGDTDFLFCPKMYQGVTHRGSLLGKDFIGKEYFSGIAAFGNKLGPIFIQVSDAFSPKRMIELFTYLAQLPKEFNFFLEVRHPDWFGKKEVFEQLTTTLTNLGIGIVITDTSGRRDCANMTLTVPKTFIRYVGNSLHPTDYTRIDNWVLRLQQWLKAGLEEAYFFMHMHDEATSPELTVYLIDQLNTILKTALIRPQFIPQPNTLF